MLRHSAETRHKQSASSTDVAKKFHSIHHNRFLATQPWRGPADLTYLLNLDVNLDLVGHKSTIELYMHHHDDAESASRVEKIHQPDHLKQHRFHSSTHNPHAGVDMDQHYNRHQVFKLQLELAVAQRQLRLRQQEVQFRFCFADLNTFTYT
jgi:hypothetical protein